MAKPKHTISPEGKAKAEAELKHLTEVKRPEIRQAIKTAREFGDLSENAEYHAAREAQAMNESRIRVLEHQLANAVVSEAVSGGVAGVGSQVSYRDAEQRQGDRGDPGPPRSRPISPRPSSPSRARSARRCSGAAEGDEVTFETPRGGEKRLEVMSVA